MKNAVEILHLTKRFGSRTAVSDLTLTVRVRSAAEGDGDLPAG